MAAHNHDQEDDLCSPECLSPYARHSRSKRTKQNLSNVCHVVEVRICHFDMPDDIAGISCDETKSEYQYKTSDNANGSKHGRQGQDPKRYCLCYHCYSRLPPGHCAMFDFRIALISERIGVEVSLLVLASLCIICGCFVALPVLRAIVIVRVVM